MADKSYENSYYQEGKKYIVGIDEAGRGPLAGPLVVAGVILPETYENPKINDSKKLTSKSRSKLYDEIVQVALAYAIVVVDIDEIDRINIYQATKEGMIEVIRRLNHPLDAILTDAMPLSFQGLAAMSLIRGDLKSQSIASASILAKVYRDRLMDEYAKQYPGYGFDKNKGYGTKLHLEALKIKGITPIHRKTYEPVKSLLNQQLSFTL